MTAVLDLKPIESRQRHRISCIGGCAHEGHYGVSKDVKALVIEIHRLRYVTKNVIQARDQLKAELAGLIEHTAARYRR